MTVDGVKGVKGIDTILEEKKIHLLFKRLFDVVLSLIGILAALPVFTVVAVLIKKDTAGPVFFRQVRVGQYGTEFKMLKFRTMVHHADRLGLNITVGGDWRITKVGAVLRRFKIDELPQLLNIFIGEMSFVGPRPEVPEYVSSYTAEQRLVLKLKPGITDYASIVFNDESSLLEKSGNPEKTYIEEIMPAKFKLNMRYFDEISIFCDIRLILMTLAKIIRGR